MKTATAQPRKQLTLKQARRVRTLTAHHEAGHAVMPYVLPTTRALERVTINLPLIDGLTKKGSLAKLIKANKPLVWGGAFGDGLGLPDHEQTILISMAGPLAEIECCNSKIKWRRRIVKNDDVDVIKRAIRKLGPKAKTWATYERRALALVRKHKRTIKRAARALIKYGTLSGEDIEIMVQMEMLREMKPIPA